MSMGYIGYCRKSIEDEKSVIYEYSGGNWNIATNDREAETAYDGEIYIDKNKFNTDVLSVSIEEKSVYVMKPCKNAFFRVGKEIDYIALKLLLKIHKSVRNNGIFPEKEVFIV